MRTAVKKPNRSSRWTRDPVMDDGQTIVAYPTDRDLEVFKLLTRYRYLPSDYIHAFVGGSLNALTRRLNLLSRKPNLYLARPHQQRLNADANHRRLIYELDERGSRVLRERGLPFLPKTYHRNFQHELMVAQITASFELGTRELRHVSLVMWPQILSSPSTPKQTRDSGVTSIPVAFDMCGDRLSILVTADAQPFGIQRTIGTQSTYLFFPGIEADCGTEPIETSDLDRSSISKKFAAYSAIAEQGIYRSHFGFPNFFVPIITTTSVRMQSMIRMLEKVTDGRGSKMFLFKTFPAFASVEKPPKPGGHMLREPWQRAGFPPFHLDR
jgi:hypothetical protein